MKILIVGGGIGGLAAAGFLEKKGFDITLIERAPEFKNIGFSMSIFSNGRRLLRELGIDDELAKGGYEIPWLDMADTKGHSLGVRIHFKEFMKSGEHIISIERANLHALLVKNLKNTKVFLGTTIKEIKNEKDKVHVVLSNGTKETYDLVVAADGIHSQIREEFFGHNQSSFYGWSLRFFWVPSHIPMPKGALCLSKEKVTLGFFPTIGRCCVGIYEYNPQRIDHPPLFLDDFLPYLTHHGWTAQHIRDLEKEASEGHQYYDHLRHVSLNLWYKKRLVLLGDARHGLSPVTGMGAGMALEDSYVLADELAKADKDHISLALLNYAKRRTIRVKELISLSNFAEKFYFIKSPFQRKFRDLMVRVLPDKILMDKLRKILEGGL